MEQVRIQISPKQQSKLRNGHKVRIKKPSMQGEGLNLIVMPQNFSLITKAFTKNKGTEIILSPEEILMNKQQAPSMEGEGIFGKKFDASVEKAIGRKGRKKVYGFARDVLNPIAKTALYAGIASGATALSAVQPELIPLILPAAAGTADFLGDYLDKPSDFYSKPNKNKLAKKYLEQQALNQVNSQLGTNMGYMTQAGLGKAIQDKANQALNASAIQAQQALIGKINAGIENISTLSPEEKQLLIGTQFEYLVGKGLYVSGRGTTQSMVSSRMRQIQPHQPRPVRSADEIAYLRRRDLNSRRVAPSVAEPSIRDPDTGINFDEYLPVANVNEIPMSSNASVVRNNGNTRQIVPVASVVRDNGNVRQNIPVATVVEVRVPANTSGNGLYLGRQGGSIIGLNGGMVYTSPQALQSQPMSSNFQFRYTLPVAFQSIIR